MIAGIRGVPSRHGGFETFAEDLSLFLVARNHRVTVYCQMESGTGITEDMWNGVGRVLIPSPSSSAGTIYYDWATTLHASRQRGVVLTLGYNTGVFSVFYRFHHRPNAMNMDGIEWERKKWSAPQRVWLWLNERGGALFANHLIADHPEIAAHRRHTAASKITVIPYGADSVTAAPCQLLAKYGLKPKSYYLLVARPEPENSILEIVAAFSSGRVGTPLVVLGRYTTEENKYHLQVVEAAGPGVHFLGAIYDRDVVRTLRFHAKAYIHGHRVGGTNPSLVESLAAGNAIIAHDNRFSRWVTGGNARFFKGSEDLEETLFSIELNPTQLTEMEGASRRRHEKDLDKERVLSAYEDLLGRIERCYLSK
jgi:glycosyltransferase involved in cell wall biosynthesis